MDRAFLAPRAMDRVPFEVLAGIFAALDVPSLAAARCVCQGVCTCLSSHTAWHAVSQGDTIWRELAYAAGYAASGASSAEAAATYASTSGYFDRVSGFEDLCKRCFALERRWGRRYTTHSTESVPRATPPEAHRPFELFPDMRYMRPEGFHEDVWRIKLDPHDCCVLVTGRGGGVRSLDARTHQRLWHIPPSRTRDHPHLELDQGWMVFDQRGPGVFEVWRAERTVPDLDRAPHRGAYVHHAMLHVPQAAFAYRFQYPTLMCATMEGSVFEVNVPSQTIVRMLSLDDTAHQNGNVTYIDFDEHFVFLVGYEYMSVTVLDRETGEVRWTLDGHIEAHGSPACFYSEDWPAPETHALQLKHQVRMRHAPSWLTRDHASRHQLGECTWFAVHPDAKTDTLVLQCDLGLVFLRNYTTEILNGGAPIMQFYAFPRQRQLWPVSYTHLRAHET